MTDDTLNADTVARLNAAFDHGGEPVSSDASGRLLSIIERLERLDSDKDDITADMKEVFAESKADGYDVKTLRKVLRIRKQDRAKRAEEEAILETYLIALGEV